jgi:TonB family protein
MRAQKTLTAITLACTLLAGTTPAAFAQDAGKRREQTEQQQREITIVRQEAEVMARGPLEPTIIQGVPPTPLRGDTFTFVATEMSFDHKVVKGAPYSAEAVTESVQTLADGNRIVRKQSSQIYRDGEGRTRREYTISVLGPWATQEDPPRTISINDPVAKVSYTLDPRTRTARKMSASVSAVSTTRGFAVGGPARALEVRGAELKELEMKALSETKSLLASRVLKSVDAANNRAKAAGGRGLVAVKIKVNAAGAVESAEAVTGDEALRSAAVEAARQWRFKPGEAETGAISFNFESGRATVPGEVVRIIELKKEGANGNHTMILSGVSPQPQPNVQTENLGKQLVEGVEAEGSRTTRTIPAGEIGNEQPIQIVSERWYSPELQVTVMTRQSDPRSGETTYRLTNIVRAEPAAALFQPPSDYTVKDAEFIRALPARKPFTATTPPQEN